MALGTLSGYAVRTLGGAADHTYVVSSEGHRWPCWGRSKGGQRICQGQGNVDQAECLSRRRSRAGIVYSVTGVCHQTANRILLPANITVAAALGSGKSFMVYGVYGIDLATMRRHHPTLHPWPELTTCRTSHHH